MLHTLSVYEIVYSQTIETRSNVISIFVFSNTKYVIKEVGQTYFPTYHVSMTSMNTVSMKVDVVEQSIKPISEKIIIDFHVLYKTIKNFHQSIHNKITVT